MSQYNWCDYPGILHLCFHKGKRYFRKNGRYILLRDDLNWLHVKHLRDYSDLKTRIGHCLQWTIVYVAVCSKCGAMTCAVGFRLMFALLRIIQPRNHTRCALLWND